MPSGHPSFGASRTRPADETADTREAYRRLAAVYDVVFGPILHSGRRAAIEAMAIQPGERILEVGVGTGITFPFYPQGASVVGIDLSGPMLERARERLAGRVEADTWCVAQMNAERLAFADASFDIVYAPYVMSVVPDPIAVGREMLRVCRPGGRIVILNHFQSRHPMARAIEQRASKLTRHVGFRTDLSLDRFIAQTGLTPARIEKLNLFNMSTLVACVRSDPAAAAPPLVKAAGRGTLRRS